MKGSNLKKTVSILAAFVISFGFMVNAQDVTLKSITETYNNGAKSYAEDPAKAIELLEQCIEMCNDLGEESDDIRMKAEGLLPASYYKVAMSQYKGKQYETALKSFETAYDLALLYEDLNTEKKAMKRIPSAYLGMGNNMLKTKKYEEAITYYNKALLNDKKNEKAYYYMGKAYLQMGEMEKMLESMDKAIKFDRTGPKKTKKRALKTAKNTLLKKAVTAQKAQKWAEAVPLFEKALIYSPEDVSISYTIADVQKNAKNYTEAIAWSEKTLAWEKNEVAKTKTHYLMGQVYEKMNNKVKACASYKLAAVGEFKQNADYQMVQVLKCK